MPKIAILENVKGLTFRNKTDAFTYVKAELIAIPGYKWDWKILKYVDYSLPQKRERIYFVGIREDVLLTPFEWPEPTMPVTLESIIDPLPEDKIVTAADRPPTKTGRDSYDRMVEKLERLAMILSPNAFPVILTHRLRLINSLLITFFILRPEVVIKVIGFLIVVAI